MGARKNKKGLDFLVLPLHGCLGRAMDGQDTWLTLEPLNSQVNLDPMLSLSTLALIAICLKMVGERD